MRQLRRQVTILQGLAEDENEGEATVGGEVQAEGAGGVGAGVGKDNINGHHNLNAEVQGAARTNHNQVPSAGDGKPKGLGDEEAGGGPAGPAGPAGAAVSGALEQLEAFVAHDRLSMEAHASLLFRRVEVGMKRRVVEQRLARLRHGRGTTSTSTRTARGSTGTGVRGGARSRGSGVGSRSDLGSGLGSVAGSRAATAAAPGTAMGSRYGGSGGGARPEVDYDSSDDEGDGGGYTTSQGRRPKLQLALEHLAGKLRQQEETLAYRLEQLRQEHERVNVALVEGFERVEVGDACG